MFTCEHCQPLLLPYLYDALEREERLGIKEHLEGCPACRQALEVAQQQRGMLAEAIKSEFADVRFAAPADTAKRVPEPTLVLARQPRRVATWRRWAMAAAIALAVLGTGAYFGISGLSSRQDDLLLARNQLNDVNDAAKKRELELQRQREKTASDIRAIQDQINKLVGDWNEAEAKETKNNLLRAGPNGLKIQGPKSIQAGGRNEFTIQLPKAKPGFAPLTANKANTVVARIVDEKNNNNVLVEQQIGDKGAFQFDLPRDLAVKPGAQLALVIESKGDAPFKVKEHLALVAPEYLTHLTTDRPMYRPGETVHFRSLTLERYSLKPPVEDVDLRFTITGPNKAEIYKAAGKALLAPGPHQQPIKGPDGLPLRGIGAGEFTLPPDLPGGQYTLTVVDAKERFPTEKRTFLVNKWQTPRLNKELHFTRSSYGPGDKVMFQAKATRVAGGAFAHQLVEVRAQVDKNQVAFLQLNTDADGNVKGSFDLPAADRMPKGDGIVSLGFHDGTVETLVKPLPIVLNKLDVEFHPEGGDLIAGVPNRVYFQVRTTLDKPADLQGRIVDETGADVAKIETLAVADQPQLNQGQGAFTFTPQAGKKYELKIDRPIGMEGRYPLPAIRQDGVALHVPQGVVDQTIDAVLHSVGKERQFLVGAYCRGRLLDHVNVTAKAGEPTRVILRTTPGVSGVQRVTVFEKISGVEQHQFVPVAERLIYRPADHKLNLTLKADKTTYAPGQSPTISIQAADEKNQPKAAVMLVYAADLSVIKLADDKTARLMPTHFLLTREVRKPEDLENADFLLGEHPQAKQAVDLLLGTQGWRRFAEQDPSRFQKRELQEAPRVLFAMAQKLTPDDPQVAAIAKVDEEFSPKFVAMQKKLAVQETQEAQAQQEAQDVAQARDAQAAAAQARIRQAQDSEEQYRSYVVKLGMGILVALVLIGAFACIGVGIYRATSNRPAAGFFIVGACMLIVLFMGGLSIAVLMLGSRGGEMRMAAMRDVEKNVAKAEDRALMMAPMKDAPPPPMVAMPAPNGNLPGGVGDGQGIGGKAPMGGGLPMKKFAPAGPARGNNFGRMAVDAKRRDQDAMIMEGQAGFGMAPAQMAQPPMFGDAAPQDFERELRKDGKFQDMLQRRLGRLVTVPTGLEPFVVREFAHRHQEAEGGVRSDFTETLYWHPALVLTDGDGKVTFDLSDSVTRFQVVALAHSLDGRLGSSTIEIASKLPFSLDPQVPVEVTSSDKILLPVVVANDGDKNTVVQLRPTDHTGLNLAKVEDGPDLTVNSGKRVSRLFELRAKPVGSPSTATVRFEGKTPEGLRDVAERQFRIVPDGFPISKAVSGLLEKSATHEIELPARWEDMVPGSLTVKVSAYPSTLAELQKGLDAMLREPCGCFEQSSSSNYPNVLILNYLRDTRQANPQLEERSRSLMKKGYQQLTSFECQPPSDRTTRRGYEWFGQTAPPHEALTAYGLLQFRDMAGVFPVDDKMVERTRKFLLDQRDGSGGFKRNPQALDSFGRAPNHITNAYIVWALTEAGEGAKLEKEIDALKTQAKDAKLRDPYFLSLVGLGLVNAGHSKEAADILKDVRTFQKDSGAVEGAVTSITGSAHRDLHIETTALALLGWLKANRPEEFNASVQKAAKWIGQQRGGFGGFGNTQSTILALKALIAFTKDNQKTAAAGEMKLFIGDAETPAAVQTFPAGVTDAIELALPAQQDRSGLKPGKNKLRLEVTGNTSFPYTLAWNYNALKPDNADNCPVHLTTKLAAKDVKAGDTVRLTAVVENKSGQGQGMAVAIIGLPGGLEVPADRAQLKNLAQLREDGTKPGTISYYELNNRELVLYWRDLAPDAKIEVNLDLICRLPGEYRGPASRAYLYYSGDLRFWTDPLTIAIHPE